MRWVSERSEIYRKYGRTNYTFANQIKGIHEGRLHEIKGVEEEEKQWREKAKQSFNFYFLGIGARNYLSISMVLLSQLSVIFPLLCSFSFFPFSLFFLSFFFFFERLLVKTNTSKHHKNTKEDTQPFAARFDPYLSLQTFSLKKILSEKKVI